MHCLPPTRSTARLSRFIQPAQLVLLQLTAMFCCLATGTAHGQDVDGVYPRTLDLNDDHARQVVVDREAGQYLGHPTTCLLEDGKTMLCVYPKGHGRGRHHLQAERRWRANME